MSSNQIEEEKKLESIFINLQIDQQPKQKPQLKSIVVKDCISETIQKFDIKDIVNNSRDICFQGLINQLKDMGYPFEGYDCFYYFNEGETYVFCGTEPIEENIHIDKEIYYSQMNLRIKFRESNQHPLYSIMSEAVCTSNQNNNQELKQINFDENTRCRRIKERKIGYIIKKVHQWRNYYNGTQEDGKQIKDSLEDAAKRVGISKKSLDDYLLQVRFGYQYKFNFNEHKNDKVGILRTFVKKHKAIKKQK